MRQLLGLTLLCVATLSGMVACRRDGAGTKASAIKSLDNFLVTKTPRNNECSLDNHGSAELKRLSFSSEIKTKTTEEQRNALKKVLVEASHALPERFINVFNAMEGSVYLMSQAEVAETCAMLDNKTGSNSKELMALKEGRKDVLACWINYPTSSDMTESYFGLVITANKVAIQHSLVRVAGYLTEQLLTNVNPAFNSSNKRVYRDAGLSAASVAVKKQFNAVRDKLTEEFLKDMHGKYDIDLDTMLGSGVTSYVRENAALPSSVSASMRSQFASFVMAEYFDSIYCSKQSQDLLKKDFANSYTLYAQIDQAYAKLYDHMLGITTVGGNSSAMGLVNDESGSEESNNSEDTIAAEMSQMQLAGNMDIIAAVLGNILQLPMVANAINGTSTPPVTTTIGTRQVTTASQVGGTAATTAAAQPTYAQSLALAITQLATQMKSSSCPLKGCSSGSCPLQSCGSGGSCGAGVCPYLNVKNNPANTGTAADTAAASTAKSSTTASAQAAGTVTTTTPSATEGACSGGTCSAAAAAVK